MGLTFAHTESTFMKKYAVPSGGDWSIHQNAMIFTQGTEDLIISGNILNGPGGNGIFIRYSFLVISFYMPSFSQFWRGFCMYVC